MKTLYQVVTEGTDQLPSELLRNEFDRKIRMPATSPIEQVAEILKTLDPKCKLRLGREKTIPNELNDHGGPSWGHHDNSEIDGELTFCGKRHKIKIEWGSYQDIFSERITCDGETAIKTEKRFYDKKRVFSLTDKFLNLLDEEYKKH